MAAEKHQFIDDQRQRNAVEDKIGQGKRRYGLGLICYKLAVNQGSTIASNVLVFNLQKLLELLFVPFAYWLQLLSNEQGEMQGLKILRPQISPVCTAGIQLIWDALYIGFSPVSLSQEALIAGQ